MNIDNILKPSTGISKHLNVSDDMLIYVKDAKEAIKEIVKETLRMASEDAKIKFHDGHFKEDKPLTYFQSGGNNLQIDKYSITNVYNKIKF